MASQRSAALVTGASSGIGCELARVFAEHNYDIVLVARREDRMRALADEIHAEYGVETYVFPADLSLPGAANGLYDAVRVADIDVEVLVNNAGVALTEPFHETDHNRLMGLVQVNAVALTALTHLFLQSMVPEGRGRILNVASIVSFFPTPSFAAYGATKAMVLSLTEAISEELRGTGVTVTAVCPGYTETEMIDGALEATGKAGMEGYIPKFVKQSAQAVAKEAFDACMAGKAIHVTGPQNQLAAEWIRHQPKWLVRAAGGLFSRILS